jgi:hypothetical protein
MIPPINRLARRLVWGLALLAIPQGSAPLPASSEGTDLAEDVRPLLKQRCFACHNSSTKTAEFDFEDLLGRSPDSFVRDFRSWETVADQIHYRAMPPEGAPAALSPDERAQLTAWIDRQLETADLGGLSDPIEPLIRRLTRVEFENTVRDLTGIDAGLIRFLPADGLSEDGLPNNGNSQFFDAPQLEKLLAASEELFRHASYSPTQGFRFQSKAPAAAVRFSDRVKDAARNFAKLYFSLTQKHVEEDGAVWERYFLAAWEWRWRERSASPITLEDVSKRFNVRPEILRRSRRFLETDYQAAGKDDKGEEKKEFQKFAPHLEPVFGTFESLPVPADEAEFREQRSVVAEAARRFSAALRHLREQPDYLYTISGSDHSHPFDINVSKAKTVYLSVTDGGDDNTNDFAAWLDGTFRMRDGSRRLIGDVEQVKATSADSRVRENTNSRGEALHVFTQASYLRQVRDRLYEHPARMHRSHVLYRDNTIPWEQAWSVRAPSLVAVRVPEGAVRFTVRGAMQDITRTRPGEERRGWVEDGMVQFFVSINAPASLGFVPGARLTFANRTQYRGLRTLLDDLLSPAFPTKNRWVRAAIEEPGEKFGDPVLLDDPRTFAAALPAAADAPRKELLRRWDEYMLLIAEPRYMTEHINAILNAERRLLLKKYPGRVLTLDEVRELGDQNVTERVVLLDDLLAKGTERLRSKARKHLAAFAYRAYRRPPSTEEVDALMGLLDSYLDDEKAYTTDAVKFAARSTLVSPQFLYLSERRPAGSEGRPLDGFELASRLSYFLWSTMPDHELLRAASDGALGREDVLIGQSERMLRDERALAMADQFFGTWLGFRRILTYEEPNHELFPEYTNSLRQAMYDETLLFAGEMIRKNGNVLNLVDSRFTYVNGELARHYGIDAVEGEEFRRVDLKGADRGGLLGMASVLTLTSHPARTSPVDRGVYVLKYLLGSPPPPPPPGAASQFEQKQAGEAELLSFRAQLEQHRDNPACNACHQRIDPMGFALEGFDPIGRSRTKDPATGERIDTSAQLPDGTSVASFGELKKALLSGRERKKFVRHFCRQLLAYALSRSVTYQDLPTLRTMEAALSENDYGFREAVRVVVRSRAFRFRPVTETHAEAQTN